MNSIDWGVRFVDGAWSLPWGRIGEVGKECTMPCNRTSISVGNRAAHLLTWREGDSQLKG